MSDIAALQLISDGRQYLPIHWAIRVDSSSPQGGGGNHVRSCRLHIGPVPINVGGRIQHRLRGGVQHLNAGHLSTGLAQIVHGVGCLPWCSALWRGDGSPRSIRAVSTLPAKGIRVADVARHVAESVSHKDMFSEVQRSQIRLDWSFGLALPLGIRALDIAS